MLKELLFISSANLTTNPRLLKELRYAVELGNKVDFIGFKLGNWSDKIDEELTKTIKADFHYISASKTPFIPWFLSSVIEKLSKQIFSLFKADINVNAYAHSKRSYLLNQYLKRNKTKYDLILAHTLPALFPTSSFAQKTNTKFTFDIEDYHPGEATSDKNEVKRREFLMKNILPKTSFITYASPLIGKESLNLLDKYPENQHQLINNCFSQTEFQLKKNNSEKVKFVWFSQNISHGRGLELVVPALAKFKDKIELHLIGNLYPPFNNTCLSKYSDFIKIHKPLPQKELNLKLSEFDVGMALELKTADFNRQICLTNKIWAYLQSGLYVLATDTLAQTKFLEEHKSIGITAKQNNTDFTNVLEKIITGIVEIRDHKQTRFNYAQKLSWENESKKLIEIWKTIL